MRQNTWESCSQGSTPAWKGGAPDFPADLRTNRGMPSPAHVFWQRAEDWEWGMRDLKVPSQIQEDWEWGMTDLKV